MNFYPKLIFVTLIIFTIFSCKENVKPVKKQDSEKVTKKLVKAPVFNEDSAYKYIQNQVNFGPRVPGTKAHSDCAKYFNTFFNKLGFTTTQQMFKARTFDNKIFDGKNIIASINPENNRRILLCAHWDSRPFADHDNDKSKHYTPIDGANDGASGAGVLMEIARQISIKNITVGIDIILFDLEDYGLHANEKRAYNSDETWCLGSQYWAKNPHKPGYFAMYGILLDMVGADSAVFGKEYFSKHFAPGVVEKVWRAASDIGYGKYFVNNSGGQVLDDHIFINKFANIPTINIIHYQQGGESGFFPYWHTVEDNIDKISKETLKAVGQTVLEVIYKEL